MIPTSPSLLSLHSDKKISLPLILSIGKVEVGLWIILFLGALLGHLKRYVPVPDTSITILYDFLCFSLLSIVILKRILHSRRLYYSRATPIIMVFTLFVLITAFNPMLATVGQGLLGWRFVASGILLHFLGYYAFENESQIWRLLRVFWTTAIIISIYGLIQLLRGYSAIELDWIQNLSATMMIAGTGRFRLMSTLGSAVDLGLYLTLAIATLSCTILFKRPTKLSLFALIIMSAVLLFTFVRAAWFATFIAILLSVAKLFWHKKLLRLLYPIALLIVFTSIWCFPYLIRSISPYLENPALQERVISLANPLKDQSILDRLHTWDGVWATIKENPYGVGVGMSGGASLRYPTTFITTTDNSYLKILLEMGWLGLSLFLLLISKILFHGILLSSTLQGNLKILSLAFTTSFAAFIVILFFGEYIELNPSRNILWIFSGILFSLPRFRSPTEQVHNNL